MASWKLPYCLIAQMLQAFHIEHHRTALVYRRIMIISLGGRLPIVMVLYDYLWSLLRFVGCFPKTEDKQIMQIIDHV